DANAAIAAAEALIGNLKVPPSGCDFLDPSVTSALTLTLDLFNNGILGTCPAHCGSTDPCPNPPNCPDLQTGTTPSAPSAVRKSGWGKVKSTSRWRSPGPAPAGTDRPARAEARSTRLRLAPSGPGRRRLRPAEAGRSPSVSSSDRASRGRQESCSRPP